MRVEFVCCLFQSVSQVFDVVLVLANAVFGLSDFIFHAGSGVIRRGDVDAAAAAAAAEPPRHPPPFAGGSFFASGFSRKTVRFSDGFVRFFSFGFFK